jgi:biotin carboxyl carrier protein
MRYFATLRGKPEPVPLEVETAADGRYVISLDGKKHTVDVLTLDHGAVSMLIDDQSFSVEFEEHEDEVGVLVRNQVTYVDVADERRLRMRAVAGSLKVEGKQLITSPMPGKVVKVLVVLGQEVLEGQGLVVVEAMKMENELRSPKAGKVTELFAKEGNTVENNAKLAVVE